MGGKGSGGKNRRREPEPLASDRDPWARQPKESGVAFEAFVTYRDMGPGRTIRATAARLTKSDSVCKDWSSRWNWPDRANAFDNHFDRLLIEGRADRVRQMQERHINAGKAMQAIGNTVLNQVARKLRENPKSVELKVSEALALVEAGASLERKNLGEPDFIARLLGDGTDDKQVEALMGRLSDMQIQRIRDGEPIEKVLADD